MACLVICVSKRACVNCVFVLRGTAHTIPNDSCMCKYVCALASLQLSLHIHLFSDDWTSVNFSKLQPLELHSNKASEEWTQIAEWNMKLTHVCIATSWGSHLIWNTVVLDGQSVCLRSRKSYSSDVDRGKPVVDANRQQTDFLPWLSPYNEGKVKHSSISVQFYMSFNLTRSGYSWWYLKHYVY